MGHGDWRGRNLKGWELKGMGPQRDGISEGWDPKGSPHKEKGSQSMEIRGVPLQRDVNPKVHPIRRGAAGSWVSLGSHPKGSPHKERGGQAMEIGGVQPQRDVTPNGDFVWRGAARPRGLLGSHPKESPHKEWGSRVTKLRGFPPVPPTPHRSPHSLTPKLDVSNSVSEELLRDPTVLRSSRAISDVPITCTDRWWLPAGR